MTEFLSGKGRMPTNPPEKSCKNCEFFIITPPYYNKTTHEYCKRFRHGTKYALKTDCKYNYFTPKITLKCKIHKHPTTLTGEIMRYSRVLNYIHKRKKRHQNIDDLVSGFRTLESKYRERMTVSNTRWETNYFKPIKEKEDENVG